MSEKMWQMRPPETGFEFEVRAALAWEMMERFAVVAAKENGEDSAGRQALRLQTPQEVVGRAFDLADAFVNEALRREEIRPSRTFDQSAIMRGRYAAVESQVQFALDRAFQAKDGTEPDIKERLEDIDRRTARMQELVAAWAKQR